MTAKMPKISYPVPSNKNGHPFSSVEELLSVLGGEGSGLYLVGSQGMWHGGIHITDATIPWCALSTDSMAEREYCPESYKGEQFIRCMADGEIVAWRVSKDYESAAIEWRGEKLFLSTSFVLVKHYIQPGDTEESGLTFFALYMNLAPYAAYKQQGSLADRKVAGVQRYYSSAEDLQAGRAAGKLGKDTVVTLSDTIVTRSSDQRQFTEVTITRETKNTAGETLAAGTRIWTVSDQGYLKATESVPVPSWWAKCSPAYTNESEGVVNCTSRTNWAYYLSSDDVLQYKNAGSLVADFPLSYEPGNTAQQVIRPGKNPGDAARTFSLVTLGRDKDKLKKGDRVWVVSDGDSLTPVAPAASGSGPVFNDVYVPSEPVPINAGDSLGHMGFYQLPEENGKRSRYQVHIECLSMDDMEKFITNPGRVGEDTPVYLTWQADALLFEKGEQGMVAGSRKTKISGIVRLAKVPGVDAAGTALSDNKDAAYFQIRQEGGWLSAASVQKVSQYALGELGFVTLDKAPASFDLIDGINQPNNVVKGILEQLYKAAQEETRTTHALNKYNYKRLLEMIDSNQDGYYSEQEYLQAIHNVSYRDHLYRVIAKHASEWYYGKDDQLWKTYLDTLTTDAPLWKTYLEAFLDKMTWMKAVSEKGVALGPEVWHMHPIVFLNVFQCSKCNCEELYADKFGVVKYGSQYGPLYKGHITLAGYTRWDGLISSGKVTSDEKTILVAMSENEGNMDAVHSYDSEVITAGAMQKTVKDESGLEGKGELSTQFAKFRDAHPDLYESHAKSCGWTVDGSQSSAVIYYSDSSLTNGNKITSSELKTLLRQGCSESTYNKKLHNKPLAALVKVLTLPEYLDIQVLDFIERLHNAENKVVTDTGIKIKDFVKSNFGRAVVLDHSVNRPGYVVPDFKKAIENFHANNPTLSLEPQTWGSQSASNESKLLEEYKLTRRMTDSTLRYNSLKAKL
ncbi:hypothetical protein [Klebsiella aerogenes]|jgi:hypothetical protein|uniref:hypothetical protein n=1 Tax=Klebsiella aerogenes TaxID=548 RepID=UPI001D195337|nr:hypothetical protein [Klebsiella aerogenes]